MAIPNLNKYFKKGVSYLSAEEIKKLADFKLISEQATLFAGNLSVEMVRLLPEILILAQTGVNENLKDVRTTIFDLFSSAFISSVKTIVKNLDKDIESEENILLSGALTSRVADILEVVLNFEKKINEIHPELSHEIIGALGNAIVLTLAIQCPVIALVVKFSGVIEMTQNFLDCDNLEKSIAKLRRKKTEVENNQTLAPLLEKAETLGRRSLDSGIQISTLQIANLSQEAVTDIVKIPQNDSYKQLTQQLNQEAGKIPLSKDMVQRQMNDIKLTINKLIDNSGLNSLQNKEAKQNLEHKINEAAKIVSTTIGKDHTILQKIQGGHLAVNKIQEFVPNNINKNTKESLSKNVDKILDKQLALFNASLTEGIKKSPQLAKQLGLNKVMELSIQKLSSSQREAIRAR